MLGLLPTRCARIVAMLNPSIHRAADLQEPHAALDRPPRPKTKKPQT